MSTLDEIAARDKISEEEQVIRDWLDGQLSPSGSPLPPSRRTSQPIPRRQVTAVVATLIEIIDDLRATDQKTYRDGRSDGHTDGLVDAMQRLSDGGMHHAGCPEPEESCTCGIDAFIQQPPAGMAPVPLSGFVSSPWGRARARFLTEGSDRT